jgi:hypothetical protein
LLILTANVRVGPTRPEVPERDTFPAVSRVG